MPKKSETLYQRTLKRAAELVGGEQTLAAALDVRPARLALWLKGFANPDVEVFLKAVDIVIAHDGDAAKELLNPGAHASKEDSGGQSK